MWIKSRNKNLEKIFYKNFMEEPANFSDNGKAQVKRSVGKKLIKKSDDIEAVKDEKDKNKEVIKETKSKGDQ